MDKVLLKHRRRKVKGVNRQKTNKQKPKTVEKETYLQHTRDILVLMFQVYIFPSRARLYSWAPFPMKN